MSRRHQSYRRYRRTRQRRAAYAARYQRERQQGQSSGKGCAIAFLALPGFVLVFWPLALPYGGWNFAVLLPWLGLLAVVAVLIGKHQRQLKERAAMLDQQRQMEWGRQMQAARSAEEARAAAALEQARRTGWLELNDGNVAAYSGVTSSGSACHHRHRTPQAAAQCAARLGG